MTLQNKLDALKAEIETKLPAEVIGVFSQATAELVASGQAQRALKAGDRVPLFTLPDANGNVVSADELLARGPVVVTFYRGVWCPYCNLDLQALQAAAVELQLLGASLVAISQQTPANSRKSERDNKLGFPILSDHGGEVAAAFGLRFSLPDYLRDTYKALSNNLPVINGEHSWTLPMPARYVIGQDGVIAYSEVNPDYTQRPNPSELLPVLKSLRRAAAA
jgi:peroxiredoxin